MTVVRPPKTLVLALLALAPFVTNAADNGWYLGADIGQSSFHIKSSRSATTATFSESDTSTTYALSGGYRFNQYVALEAGYQNLGKYKLTVDGYTGSAKVNGVTAGALFQLPLNEQWSVFAKAGVMFARANTQVTDTTAGTGYSQHKNGAVPVIGVGVSYAMDKHWTLRAQYQDIGAAHIAEGGSTKVKLRDDVWSLGMIYNF